MNVADGEDTKLELLVLLLVAETGRILLGILFVVLSLYSELVEIAVLSSPISGGKNVWG